MSGTGAGGFHWPISTELAWLINFVLLAIVAIIAILIGRNAYLQKGYSLPGAIVWACFAFFTFPIGAGLYLIVSRWNKTPTTT